jgi:autotransporter-associated beta strand protein
MKKDNTGFTAATRVYQGALRLTTANATGTNAGGILVQNGASLELSGGLTFVDDALTITGNGISSGGALKNFSGANTYQGAITIGNGGARISNADTGNALTVRGITTARFADVTFGGAGSITHNTSAISGAGQVIKDGAGTLTMSFANTYTGGTRIDDGAITLGLSDVLFNTGAVNINGGALNIAGNSDTVGAVTLTSGSINGTTGVLTGTSYAVQSGTVDAILGGASVALTKTTVSTVTLGKANTYTGATTVTAGTLLVNGSTSATSAVAVNGTSTLGGTGTIGGNVTVAATASVAPGASVGTLSIGGDLTLTVASSDVGTLHYELDTIIASDKIVLTAGTLDIGTAALGLGDFNFTNLGGLENGTYTLIQTNSAITGTLAGDTNGTFDGATIVLQKSGDGTDIELVVSGVGGSTYDAWATGMGLTGANNAKTDDPDGDGKNNLYEYAFNGDPLSGANDGKIVGKVATVGGEPVMTLTLPVRTGAVFSNSSGDELSALIDGIHYRIEGDVDLGTFADDVTEVLAGAELTAIQAGLPGLSATPGSGWTYRTFRVPGTVLTTPKAFLRAKVSETP